MNVLELLVLFLYVVAGIGAIVALIIRERANVDLIRIQSKNSLLNQTIHIVPFLNGLFYLFLALLGLASFILSVFAIGYEMNMWIKLLSISALVSICIYFIYKAVKLEKRLNASSTK